jgi:hydroxypyruvate reductase
MAPLLKLGKLYILLSGGASSLMVDPAQPIEMQDGQFAGPGLQFFGKRKYFLLDTPQPITLADYRAIVHALLRAGAPIWELNAVRKHIDRVKGGRLAQRWPRLPIELLVISDVPGDELSVIGSGPMSPDPTTYHDALAVLERRGCRGVAPAITAFLGAGARGEYSETPKPGDPIFNRVHPTILASNGTAVDAAAATLDQWGFDVVEAKRDVQGEASTVGAALAREASELGKSSRRRAAIVWGGETTVTVGQSTGRGGRNQELALAAAIGIEGQTRAAIATFATDGVDGPTDAAGAIVTWQTCTRARSCGFDPHECLANHDSYTLLDRIGALIRTGPTGTNVNDLAIALLFEEPAGVSAGKL